uniref:Uncharacterized protein n=1 Tax=Romanomermis culicivorax TaxID=13658 RepID=A0A915KDJ8_ROMCU
MKKSFVENYTTDAQTPLTYRCAVRKDPLLNQQPTKMWYSVGQDRVLGPAIHDRANGLTQVR